MSNGEYYFIVVSYNRFGNISSNCIKIIIERKIDGDDGNDGDSDGDGIPNIEIEWWWWIILLIIGMVTAITFYLRRNSSDWVNFVG